MTPTPITPEKRKELERLYSEKNRPTTNSLKNVLQDSAFSHFVHQNGEEIAVAFLHSLSLMEGLRAENEKLRSALLKLHGYNTAIMLGQINYRPEDHAQVAAEALSTSPKSPWMPIETCPEEGDFLVYMPEENERHRIHSAYFRKTVKVVGGRFHFDCKPITHWMPLPQPPTPQPEGGMP